MWTFVQFRHFLEETMLIRLVVTVVFSVACLSQRIEAWWSILRGDTLQTSKTNKKVEYMMIVI